MGNLLDASKQKPLSVTLNGWRESLWQEQEYKFSELFFIIWFTSQSSLPSQPQHCIWDTQTRNNRAWSIL